MYIKSSYKYFTEVLKVFQNRDFEEFSGEIYFPYWQKSNKIQYSEVDI